MKHKNFVLDNFKKDKKIFRILKINKKKFFLKEFKSKQKKKFINELKAYKFYKFKKIFNIPNLIKYNFNKKQLFLNYIKGKKPSYFEIAKVYNLENIQYHKKKISYFDYIVLRYKKDYQTELILNRIKKKILTPKFVLLSFTHGDFVNYNCVKNKKKFYVFDFENFNKRIIFFDYFNWYSHPLLFNFSKLTNFFKNYLIQSTIKKILLSCFIIFLFLKSKSMFKLFKVNQKEFEFYYICYVFEKYLILKRDNKDITNYELKILSNNLIKFLEFELKRIT